MCWAKYACVQMVVFLPAANSADSVAHRDLLQRDSDSDALQMKKHMHIFLCCEHLQHMCQTDMDVFLICWSLLYLHVFSEVAAR